MSYQEAQKLKDLYTIEEKRKWTWWFKGRGISLFLWLMRFKSLFFHYWSCLRSKWFWRRSFRV